MILIFLSFPLILSAYTTNDPLFERQFNVQPPIPGVNQFFKNNYTDINVLPIWEAGLFGDDVVISIVGNKCNIDHEDLNIQKYMKKYSLNIDSIHNFTSPNQKAISDLTTAALGIVVAEKNNGKGIHGIAPNANYYCIQQTDMMNNEMIAHSISVNNIYTDVKLLTIPRGLIETNKKIISPIFHEQIDQAIESIPKTIIVSPVGVLNHFYEDGNFFPEVRHPDVISVADTTLNGLRSRSARGTCIVCNAPAGFQSARVYKYQTIPVLSAVYNKYIYDKYYPKSKGYQPYGIGSSSVAGVITLMKSVNKNLEPKDVRAIIALTSQINDPIHESWTLNKAGFWYSDVYGFGRIDAEKCIYLSQSWNTLPQLESISFTFPNTNLYSSQGGILTVHGKCDGSNSKIKFIDYVTLEFECKYTRQLRISVESGQKTIAKVVLPSNYQFNDDKFKFTIRNFFGESCDHASSFSIFVSRDGYGEQTYIKDIKLTIYGYDEIPLSLKREPKQTMTTNFRNSYTPNYKFNIKQFTLTCNANTLPYSFPNERTFTLFDREYNTFFNYNEWLNVITLPCILNNKTNIKLLIQEYNENYFHFGENEIELINPYIETKSFINPSPYKAHYIKDNAIMLDYKFAYNWEKVSSDPYSNMFFIGVYDIDTKTDIFTTITFLTENSLFLNVNKDHPHAILYVFPYWHPSYDGCNTLIQPIQIISNKTYIDENFAVPISGKCKAPPGIHIIYESESQNRTLEFIKKHFLYILLFMVIPSLVIIIIIKKHISNKHSSNAHVLNFIDDSTISEQNAVFLVEKDYPNYL